MSVTSLAPVLLVLNMKGGVGKTTISAHVMRVLYHRYKLKTLLIDLDPQFNLSQALISRADYDKLKKVGHTTLSAFERPSEVGLFDVNTAKTPPPKATKLAKRLREFSDERASLDLLPGDFDLVKYSLISNSAKLDFARDRFLRFIGEARKDYKLVVIDCNPSSSFITTCGLRSCSSILVPVRPDRYSMLGLELLADLVERIPAINPKPEFHVLLNCMERRATEKSIENQLRGHSKFGAKVLINGLPKSNLLEARSNYTGFATDKPVPYRNLLKKDITKVVDELAETLGFTL